MVKIARIYSAYRRAVCCSGHDAIRAPGILIERRPSNRRRYTPFRHGLIIASVGQHGPHDARELIGQRHGGYLSASARLFRRRFLEELDKAHRAGLLQFFGEYATLADAAAFADWLTPLWKCEWVVYAKRPFAGPQAVLAYLSRYTHRVAISNARLLALDEHGVTFRWKDYRAKGNTRHKTMTLSGDEFIRRFLLHVLPGGFHRIRHYGLLANAERKSNLAKVRELLHVVPSSDAQSDDAGVPVGAVQPTFTCPHCGASMIIIQTLLRVKPIRAPPQRLGPS
jgi:hypothetical protein